MREGQRGRFDDLDYFCESYKMIFRLAVPKLREEVRHIMGAHASADAERLEQNLTTAFDGR